MDKQRIPLDVLHVITVMFSHNSNLNKSSAGNANVESYVSADVCSNFQVASIAQSKWGFKNENETLTTIKG